MLEQKIEQDLKTALLAGDARRVSTLRGLKSVILYAKVAAGKRESGLSEDEIISLLSKEAKKRQESADLYQQGGRPELAESELAEKVIIEAYLAAKLTDKEVIAIVDDVISITGANTAQDIGKVIGQVRTKAGPAADGALIARLVKERLGA